ncbi:hypothetical protein J4557_11720 [Actinomadura nitritigenes]|uniref:Uncharacterized protein n=1 Tax=Actinomadura nitritigenes TaxID=134602 RepID=A0ABS3QWK4_9ACTN|nr:hypothetical protein [Actinomadura nitritigenes]MBO2438185.1 hypothetical protein [Actinomadura nitritigenes]
MVNAVEADVAAADAAAVAAGAVGAVEAGPAARPRGTGSATTWSASSRAPGGRGCAA